MGQVPQLRISPSGPLADNSTDDGLAPPLKSVAGYLFNVAAYNSGASAPENGGDVQLSSTLISGDGSTNQDSAWFYISGKPVPSLAAASPNNTRDNIDPASTGADVMQLEAGSYVCEAAFMSGFNTTGAFTSTPGAVNVELFLLKNDGTPIGLGTAAGSKTQTNIARGPTGQTFFRTDTIKFGFVINESTIADNGNNLVDNFAIKLTRVNGTAPTGLGDYDANSGILRFGRETSITIKRVD